MIRINLLPPEIIERRKWERFYPYVFAAAAVLVTVVVVAWLGLQLAVNRQNEVLQQTKSSTASVKAQAEAFEIFERKQQELEARQQLALDALSGRVDMGKLAEDVSLVLPDEAFVTSMLCAEDLGLTLNGNVSISSAPEVKQGYKSVAATLVRLASIEELYDVWLSSASVEQYLEFQPEARTENASGTVMSFSATSKIHVPDAADPAQ